MPTVIQYSMEIMECYWSNLLGDCTFGSDEPIELTYNCVDSCQEVSDDSGDYSTLNECRICLSE